MPGSVILGKAATAHILGKTGTELPDRQVIDIGVGFDFTTIEEGGVIFFDDPLQHIPVYQVGELAGNALKRLDIAILSIPVGDSTGWYREDIGRRFAATLAAFVEYKGAEGQSIAVVFLGRTDEIRAALAAKVQDHPELADSGNPAPLQARIRALLGLPSVFASQFAEMCRFLEIKTLTDAGCGDFGWMQTLSERFSLYLGLDLNPAIVTDLDYRFGGKRGHFFSCRDVTVHPLPAMDAILCRDLFSGLSVKAAQAFLANVKASGSRYLMASTVPGGPAPLDLAAPPFDLPLPLLQFEDDRAPGWLLGVWQIPGQN